MNNTIREKIEEIILGLALRAMALGARDEDTKAYYIQPQVDKLVSLFSQEVEEIIEEMRKLQIEECQGRSNMSNAKLSGYMQAHNDILAKLKEIAGKEV